MFREKVAELVAELDFDEDRFNRGFGRIRSIISTGLKTAIASAVAGIGIATVTTKMAADAEEAANKFKEVFKEASRSVQADLTDFGKAAGRSVAELKDMASSFGALLKPMGMTGKKAGETSVMLAKLVTDLASFNNTSEEAARIALFSGLVGEAEPLRRYGVQLSEARVKQEAFALKLAKTEKGLTPLVKLQARLSIIMKDTTQAQGDAARTASSLTNQMRRLGGLVHDTGLVFGRIFAPLVRNSATVLADLINPIRFMQGQFDLLGATIEQEAIKTFRELGDAVQQVSSAFGMTTGFSDIRQMIRGTGQVVRELTQQIADLMSSGIVKWAVGLTPLIAKLGAASIAVDLLTKSVMALKVLFVGLHPAMSLVIAGTVALGAAWAEAAAKGEPLIGVLSLYAEKIIGMESLFGRLHRAQKRFADITDLTAEFKKQLEDLQVVQDVGKPTAEYLDAKVQQFKAIQEDVQRKIAEAQSREDALKKEMAELSAVLDPKNWWDTSPIQRWTAAARLKDVKKEMDLVTQSTHTLFQLWQQIDAQIANSTRTIAEMDEAQAAVETKKQETTKVAATEINSFASNLKKAIIGVAKDVGKAAGDAVKEATKIGQEGSKKVRQQAIESAKKMLNLTDEQIAKLEKESRFQRGQDAAMNILADALGIDPGLVREEMAPKEKRPMEFVGLEEMTRRLQMGIGADPRAKREEEIAKNSKKQVQELAKVNQAANQLHQAIMNMGLIGRAGF